MQEAALEEAFEHWMSLDNVADHAGYANEDKNTSAEMAWSQFSALRRSFDDANVCEDIRLNAPPGY
jgi:hypothetical protein